MGKEFGFWQLQWIVRMFMNHLITTIFLTDLLGRGMV